MNEQQKIDFIHVIQINDLSTIKQVIDKNDNVINFILDADGSKAIHIAAQYSSLETISFLISAYRPKKTHIGSFLIHGASALNVLNLHGQAPLELAVLKNQPHNAEALMQAGVIIPSTLIHIAASRGYLKITQSLLASNPNFLNLFNLDGHTPLTLAACNLQASAVVAFLLEQGANLDFKAHGKTPLQWAIEFEHYQAIHFIICKTINEENQSTIFDFISTAEQAIELMKLSSAHTKLMLSNPRIKQLIQAHNQYSTASSIGFYKRAGRRPSFFADINAETGDVDIFHSHHFSGKGYYGYVRAFTHPQKGIIAVKTPYSWSDEDTFSAIAHKINSYQKEIKFMELALNTPNTGRLFSFITSHNQAIPNLDLRCIMPYIQGTPADEFITNIYCKHTLAQFILCMLEALMSLHDKGIIHGDIKLNNILISTGSKFKAFFIDFGLAYYITDKQAVVFPLNHQNMNTKYIAPERFYTHRAISLKPNTNQDVFSFGYMINNHMLSNHTQRLALEIHYPCIKAFARRATSCTPSRRPTLEFFHEALADAINETSNDFTAPAAMRS